MTTIDIDIDIDSAVESAVEDAMANYEYEPDYDEIRRNIEDDILYQVDEHIDLSDYIEDDELGQKMQEVVESGCHVVTDIAVDLVNQAVGSEEWHIPTEAEWSYLQTQVHALSQIIDTSSVTKAPTQVMREAYDNRVMNSTDLIMLATELRVARYQEIRYMSKPVLVHWAIVAGFGNLSNMTVAQIHELIL